MVIIGPTAVGKTKLSVEMAKALHGEIINGDAFQVYKDLNIGTAKATLEEREGIPHHLLDFLDPEESYTVSDFQHDARQVIAEVAERGRLPILVGGTGLYINAVLFKNYTFNTPPEDQVYRTELEKYALDHGNDALYALLVEKNPEVAETIHPNNVRRVIRTLEKLRDPKSKALEAHSITMKDSLYNPIVIGLTMAREELYQRINARVDKMVTEGLIEEARALFDRGLQGAGSVQAIGYKELFGAFNDEYTIEEAIRLIKRNSRRYAKRQLTWFNHQIEVEWVDMTHVERIFSKKALKIIEFVAGKIK